MALSPVMGPWAGQLAKRVVCDRRIKVEVLLIIGKENAIM
jgi:hypothetical protein